MLAGVLLVLSMALPATDTPPATVVAEAVPARPAEAMTGSEFARHTTGWGGRRRQAAAVEQLLSGNVPQSLRTLKPVRLTYVPAQGEAIEAVIWVAPDYLAIGSDDDFLYMPLTLPSAAAVVNDWGFALPTRKMVDAIFVQAERRLTPTPMPPGPRMRSSDYYLRHQRLIAEQLVDVPRGALLAGHKKDVVLTNRLASKAGRIAIYGWHRGKDDPIQPLSTVHGQRYADYSHGIRLVWDRVWIGGRLRPLYDVLKDPALAPVLTHEGVIRAPRSLMHVGGEPWGD